MTNHTDFYRLATGLRAIKIDFNYTKYRKALDPQWDGYNTNGMDIIDNNCALPAANLLTSQHREHPDIHRILLDLDYGATVAPASIGHRLKLNIKGWILNGDLKVLLPVLTEYGISGMEPRVNNGEFIELVTRHDLTLIPSTTLGHHHLILDVDLPWKQYFKLLELLGACGIIERGYVKASIRRGYSAIRPPWIKK